MSNMSAQGEMTERAPAAAAPAAAPAAAAPKQYFKGVVKQVMDGGAVVIRGPPRNGPPAERILALTNINAPRLARRKTANAEATVDEAFAWDAREFLRKMIVGKAVLGNVVHNPGNRDYGVLLLGDNPETGVDVAKLLVEEGLASCRDNCQDEALKSAQEAAKTAKKGMWGENKAEHIRNITWEVENARELVDKYKGKPIDAVIEHVIDGTTMRMFLLPDMIHVTLMMSGLRAPQTKLGPDGKPDPKQCDPFGQEAHYFTESRVLQRDVQVILESNNNNKLVGSVLHPAGNIAEALLKEGMAKCVDWSIAKVTGGPQKYRDAEKAAKDRKVRVWKDWKPAAGSVITGDKEFNGKVVEIVNGDALVVKSAKNFRKIFLSSIRPPKLEDQEARKVPGFKPLYDIPFMYEAREFLRKKLIGQQVHVVVDYMQPAQDNFPEKTCCTVTIGGVNVAEALVSKGLATCVRYSAGNDQRSSKYDDLLMAEQKAEKTGKGLHDKKNIPTHRVSDMSGNALKCKQFLPFLQRAGRMSGMVEFVASGSRFRVYIPRETCVITFLLGGIDCAKSGRTMPSGDVIKGDTYGDECAAHVKEMLLQREVEIEVENMDKAGNFIGYLFVDNTNLSIHLVQEGYASMHFTADRGNYANQIKNAEDNAKKATKKRWTNWTGDEEKENVEEQEKAALNEDRKVNLVEVLVTEVTEEGKFYGCTMSEGPALEKLMDSLREEFTNTPPLAGAYQPKRNDICAAKFVDDQWYRAKIEKTGAADAQVLYIDYGNRATVPKTKLGSLPASFHTPGGYAKLYNIALVKLPSDEELSGQGIQALKEDLMDKTVKINVEYKTGSDVFVTVHIGDEDIGKGLVEDGLLLVDKKGGRKFAKMMKEYDDSMQKAKKHHLNIWRYGDITEDDAKEFGAGVKPAR